MAASIQVKGVDKLQRAIKKNPEVVIIEAGDFLVRAMAAVRSVIWNNPWKVGASGGGVPVLTGNLRQSHRTVFQSMRAYIYPDTSAAPYAKEVHRTRPWLPYAEEQATPEINRLAKEMMKRIADNLAR